MCCCCCGGGGGGSADALLDAKTGCLGARTVPHTHSIAAPPGLAPPAHPLTHPPSHPCFALLALPPTPAGKKRLLRKCEYRRLPTRVATLHVAGSRIYVGDGQESVYFMR